MSLAFYCLAGLVAVSPVLFFVDGTIVDGLLATYIAISLTITSFFIRPGEAEHLWKLFRPIAVVSAVPAIWILIQALPNPWLIHPIWSSAQEALNETVSAGISINRGATLLTLVKYASALGIVFVAASVTIDRLRAEVLLFMLCGVSGITALLFVADGLGFMPADAAVQSSLAAVSATGVMVNAAAVDRALERYETRRSSPDLSATHLSRNIVVFGAAFALCACAIGLFASTQLIFVTAMGFVTLLIIVANRRLGSGLLEKVVIVALLGGTVVVGALIVLARPETGDILTRYSTRPSDPLIAHILANTGWSGNGAGSFASLVPIYRAFESPALEAPSTAARIAIELGRPALGVLLALAVLLLVFILRGAFQRGRDSFFPIASAACVVLWTLESFCDPSLTNAAVVITAASVVGLGLAQSVGRSAR